MRTGDKVTILMSVSSDTWHSEVYSKRVSFFSRSIRGQAKHAKFGIKGH